MPLSAYYKGKGPQVLRAMRRRYGHERGTRIFYATAHARGLAPKAVDGLKRAR